MNHLFKPLTYLEFKQVAEQMWKILILIKNCRSIILKIEIQRKVGEKMKKTSNHNIDKTKSRRKKDSKNIQTHGVLQIPIGLILIILIIFGVSCCKR